MLDKVKEIVIQAGEKILTVYGQEDFCVDLKSDDSPVTQADKVAHEFLVAELAKLQVGPILSEEGAEIPWAERSSWARYWLVDPLDGTKEFIKRNGEFTVNVALIENGVPVLGVVYAPVLGVCYTGAKTSGAYVESLKDGEIRPIKPSPIPQAENPWRIVGSRSHTSKDFDQFVEKLSNFELVSVGSSLKLCMVADGQADLYPRLIPTCEWDTAAAQAVVEAAGGCVLEWGSKLPLRYNQKESLLNPYFIVCSSNDALASFLVD